jgi:hypothetical protein
VLTRGGERAGGRARRRPPAVAAGSSTPANRRPGMTNKRAWKLCGCKRKVGVARVGVEKRPEVALAVSTDGAAMAAQWSCNARDGRRRPFYSQALSRRGR